MGDLEQIKSELSGNTNFDEEHEGELFERIAIIEEQESAGELIQGLNRTDNILMAAMLVVLGVLPIIWYAVMYF
ncbi:MULTISPECIES: hypothetical protein [Adlercreutzia]|jgi:hypothetical protein|uniref:hypothetical protein n=1 Tax=Adlercreutzia TaxID=447020 RepID=UPI000EDD3408|nr:MULTISPECIES: hypothetical protein [Adlercreutzia]MCI9672994.1 hypothetical protein [Enterorhabdus sp.]MCI9208744.1 hypothetical protein [Adlercreutzia caecimuris]MCR2037475.1 hypothetical protein [Adlercreutzia caecimuris]NBJ67119.1 hypothetical protein [Adlercreutzia caecimuris]NCA31533.1 hypothetical protein [Adlercreutzia muris]